MNDDAVEDTPALLVAVAVSPSTDHEALRERLDEAGLLGQPDIRVSIALLNGQSMDSPGNNATLIDFADHTPFFEQYAFIIQQTRSRYIALLDASCPPTRGWLAAVRTEIKKDTPVFFGPVNSGWPQDDARNVGFLIEYAQFRAPIDPDLPEYPGNNIAFQRQLLKDVSHVGEGFQKTFFIREVKEKLRIEPTACDDMVVTYYKQYGWRYYLHRRYCHGRLYGASHAKIMGFRRYLYAAGILILPILRYSRILRASRRPPTLSSSVLRFSVSIFVSECAWSLGECAGYVAGARENGVFLD